MMAIGEKFISFYKRFKSLTERERYLCEVSVGIGLVIGALIIRLMDIIRWGLF